MFKKFKMWFWNKSKTIKELIKLSRLIDVHSKKLANKLEELDQNKTYIISMPGATDSEVEDAKNAFNEASRQMKWTIPKIIFLNTVIIEKPKESET